MPLKSFKFTLSCVAGNLNVFKILTVRNFQFTIPFKDIRCHDATPSTILELMNEQFSKFQNQFSECQKFKTTF